MNAWKPFNQMTLQLITMVLMKIHTVQLAGVATTFNLSHSWRESIHLNISLKQMVNKNKFS